MWRRWEAFCGNTLEGTPPCLHGVRTVEARLFVKAFLNLYRQSKFDPVTGAIVGERENEMAGKTIQEVARSMGKTFWDSVEWSPIHEQGDRSRSMVSTIEDMLKGMENTSPSKKSQKAITPEFLRCMICDSSIEIENEASDHAIDLICGGFFFAMRSCEFSQTKEKERLSQ